MISLFVKTIVGKRELISILVEFILIQILLITEVLPSVMELKILKLTSLKLFGVTIGSSKVDLLSHQE